jgi:hypothetical protein
VFFDDLETTRIAPAPNTICRNFTDLSGINSDRSRVGREVEYVLQELAIYEFAIAVTTDICLISLV